MQRLSQSCLTLLLAATLALPPGWCCLTALNACCSAGRASHACCVFCRPSDGNEPTLPASDACCCSEHHQPIPMASKGGSHPGPTPARPCTCSCRHQHKLPQRSVTAPKVEPLAVVFELPPAPAQPARTTAETLRFCPDLGGKRLHVLLSVWLC